MLARYSMLELRQLRFAAISSHGQTARSVRFGIFEVDPVSGEVRKAGVKLKLGGQPFQVLAILLERPGDVFTREELQKRLWPDTFVDVDHNLNTAINKIREALGDSSENPRFVETLPRRGYRFIAPITVNGKVTAGVAHAAENSPTGGTESAARRRLYASALLGAFILLAAGGLWIYKRRETPATPTGRTLTRVTFDPGLQIGATWSPDGRYLAFASNRGGKFDIWVQQVSGGDPVQVTKGPAANWEPDWSPDGKYIAYRTEEGEGGILIQPAIGGTGLARKIVSFGYYPRWSPDGSLILFQSTKFGLSSKIFGLAVSDPETVREILPEVTSHGSIMSAAWHPDGKRVSLWGWQMAPTPLPTFWTGGIKSPTGVIKSELSHEVSNIVEEVAGSGYSAWGDTDFKLSWAPNGTDLYFERMFRGARNIWRMHVDPKTMRGESIERITTGAEVETEFAVSPDGKRVAFWSLSEQVRAWVFPINAARGQITGAGTAVTNGGLEAWEGSLSRDGSKLAYTAKRAGRWEIWQADMVQGTHTVVAADDLYVRNEPQWNPEGTRLAYIRLKTSTGDSQAVLWDSKTRKEEPLTDPQQGGLFIFDWSPDGKWVLASADNLSNGQTEVWRIPTETIHPGRKDWKLVAARPGVDIFQARFSPNGRWVVFEGIQGTAKGDTSSIFLIPASGGAWTQLTDGLHWDDKPHWSPDGRLLYFLSSRRGFYNVFCIPVDPEHGKTTGPSFQVTDFRDESLMVARTIPTVQIDVSRDKLMVTTSQSTGSIWVLDQANH